MRNGRGKAVRQIATALLATGIGLAGSASATLLSRGPDLVYDDVLNITWTRNGTLPGSSLLTWAQANAWAADLEFAGFDDWRLPYISVSAGTTPAPSVVQCQLLTELQCRDNELGYMFYYNLAGTFGADRSGTRTALGGEILTGIPAFPWSGTEASAGAASYVFEIGGPSQGGSGGAFSANGQLARFSAWAVRAGDVNVTVPEPQTYALLLAGLGLIGRCARRR